MVPIDETTPFFSIHVRFVGVLLLPYTLPSNYSLTLCSVPNYDCDIRERGGHEDVKHRVDDSGIYNPVTPKIGIPHR